MSSFSAVVLAAGLGTRMKSARSKVLHPIAGRPLLFYPVRAALEAGADRVVVVMNSQREAEPFLMSEFGERVFVAVQEQPRGTGEAARVGIVHVESTRVLLLCGDTPLVRCEELSELVSALDSPVSQLSLLTCVLEDPHGYGRILRDGQGQVTGVREQRDLAGADEHQIKEVNAGMYAGSAATIRDAIERLEPNNRQGELYLTDIVAFIAGSKPVTTVSGHRDALLGVNDRRQLAEAEEVMMRRIRIRHGLNGVTVRGLPRIDDAVQIAADSVIEDGVCLRGKTSIGSESTVDIGCVIADSVVGNRVVIKPYTVISASRIGDGAQLGPFAHLRPASEIEADVHVGNFVELKKTRLRRGAKANHLSYLGDADVGERSNIGAGTIFCNYDGLNKHQTTIGSEAFIGSGSQLVAPVTVGNGAYVASGTTVTMDVPEEGFAIGRTKQVNKLGYAATLRKRFQSLRHK